jgi:hypothetical protein
MGVDPAALAAEAISIMTGPGVGELAGAPGSKRRPTGQVHLWRMARRQIELSMSTPPLAQNRVAVAARQVSWYSLR